MCLGIGLPSLIPSFLPIQNEKEVLEFWKAELIPLNFARIILLQHKLFGVLLLLAPKYS